MILTDIIDRDKVLKDTFAFIDAHPVVEGEKAVEVEQTPNHMNDKKSFLPAISSNKIQPIVTEGDEINPSIN